MTLNPINYYHEIIEGLIARDIEIHPLSELKPSSKPVIGLRHDIDNHPNIALHMARYLAMKGTPGSFYLLHSASYYTRENIPQIIYKMNVAGCEIGLHNDAWAYYEKGPRVVKNELEYLRSLGAQVKGTVAHNSMSTYKAENYEVFKEKVLLDRDNGLPLGKLSMKKLGLTYEGTFTKAKRRVNLKDFSDHLNKEADIQSEEWMHKFLVDNPYCDYETYAQFWLIGPDKWAVAIRGKLHWQIGLTKVLELTETLPPTTISTFVIHPDYFNANELSEDGTITVPRPKRYPYLPNPIRIVGKKILQTSRFLRNELSQKRQSRIPLETKWENAQANYVEWAHEPLPEKYLEEVIEMGKKFSEYIGNPQKCLDIGCGNGVFGGKTYEEIGYSYLTKTEVSHIIGLDPLPLIAPLPPWLDEFKQGLAEEIPYPAKEFDKIVIATSLDHVKDPAKCISECLRVLKPEGTLYIWTSYKNYTDKYHPHGHQEEDLTHLLTSNGFKITDHRKVADNDQVFVKAQKTPEFDHQWSEIPSPAIELTQDRILELLKFTKLPPSYFKDKHCLDVGCGSGRFTWAMQQLGAKVSSFDISPKAIERCREINPGAYVQDIYNLEPNPIHDFVLCWGVLHHLPTPEKGFQKLSTQVAQGGVLHIMVYHKDTQKIYEKGRTRWPSLSHDERIKLCQNMIKRHGGNLHGWWDAFNPTYNFSYTPKEVRSWFERQDFMEITVTQEKNINIRGVKK